MKYNDGIHCKAGHKDCEGKVYYKDYCPTCRATKPIPEMKAFEPTETKSGTVTVGYRDDSKGGYEWYVIPNLAITELDEQTAWETARWCTRCQEFTSWRHYKDKSFRCEQCGNCRHIDYDGILRRNVE